MKEDSKIITNIIAYKVPYSVTKLAYFETQIMSNYANKLYIDYV